MGGPLEHLYKSSLRHVFGPVGTTLGAPPTSTMIIPIKGIGSIKKYLGEKFLMGFIVSCGSILWNTLLFESAWAVVGLSSEPVHDVLSWERWYVKT